MLNLRLSAFLGLSAAIMAMPGTVFAQREATPAIIVTAPGGDIDDDDAIKLDRHDLERSGSSNLLDAISANIAGFSLADAQGNPYQPNLIYRGFSASPLQGSAQGLAVYVDGVRFNQPFGDTVNFDLLPAAAIDSIEIKDASPVYGLNALGGVVILATKTGKAAPGVGFYSAGGDYNRAETSATAGWSEGGFSAFVSLEALHDGGWRRFSPSTLYRGFVDFGWDGDAAGLHVKYGVADTDLTGNGTAPVELLAADYRAVFTHPDNTQNNFNRISLHPWALAGPHTRFEASLYIQRLKQHTVNGDNADIDPCAANANFLCLSDATGGIEVPLRDSQGLSVQDTLGGEDYGLLNRSRTRASAGGGLVQLVDRRRLLDGENVLILGFSHDRSGTAFASFSELGALTEERGVDGLGFVIAQPDGSIAPVKLRNRTRYTGIFASDSLPLGSRLKAELGLRWNEARVRLDDRLGSALDGNHLFRRLNPGIEFDYRVSSALSLRAGYAEANRAPTPAELSCADEAAPCSLTNFFVGDPPLRQVVAKSWEAGASGRARGSWMMDWQLSSYRTTSHNDIALISARTRGRAFFQNVGRIRRQGAELAGRATRGKWTIGASYAFTDATFRSPLSLNSADNPSADADGRIAVSTGDRMPGIPRHRAVLSVDYESDRFSLGANAQAQSGQTLTGDEGNDEAQTRGFAIVNLHGSVRIFEKVRLFAEISNLFDKNYATFGTFGETSDVDLEEAPGATDPRSLGPGAPRRWLAGLKAGF